MSTQQRRSSRQFAPRHLLVASPHAGGTPYGRQVVLLLQHSSRGSLGVAINERFQESLRQIRGRMADPLLQRGGGFSRRVAFRVELVRWGPGQLDAEVNQGVWLTSPAKLHEVFGSHNDLWIDLVRHIGRSVLSDALKIQNMPPDPTVN